MRELMLHYQSLQKLSKNITIGRGLGGFGRVFKAPGDHVAPKQPKSTLPVSSPMKAKKYAGDDPKMLFSTCMMSPAKVIHVLMT